MKQRIDALVVVEGKSDTQRLQQYYDVDTFETSGMELNETMLEALIQLSKKRNIIVFTYPDMPGEYIRNKIVEHIPTVQHVILNKKDAESYNKKKLGVEHAAKAALDEAFLKVHALSDKANLVEGENFTQEDMLYYGFVGLVDSKKRRDYIANQLHLGMVNAKQFLKRLNLFQVSKENLETELETYLNNQAIKANLNEEKSNEQ